MTLAGRAAGLCPNGAVCLAAAPKPGGSSWGAGAGPKFIYRLFFCSCCTGRALLWWTCPHRGIASPLKMGCGGAFSPAPRLTPLPGFVIHAPGLSGCWQQLVAPRQSFPMLNCLSVRALIGSRRVPTSRGGSGCTCTGPVWNEPEGDAAQGEAQPTSPKSHLNPRGRSRSSSPCRWKAPGSGEAPETGRVMGEERG